ncbi:MAG: lysyl oxidase family protein [Gammaproteobacteria bacterium]
MNTSALIYRQEKLFLRIIKSFIYFNFLIALTLAFIFSNNSYAARNSLENRYDIAVYENNDKPDLTVDPIRLQSQLHVIDRFFDENDPIDQCIFEEGAINGFGWRRLMVFDVVIVNAGDGDLVIGDRSDPDNPYEPIFYLDECHGHYHMEGFSEYLVRDADQNIVASGHKQGFCFEDSFKFTDHPGSGFNCEFQGITSGWGDWYYKQLPGQWVDVTDLPSGNNYILEVNINIQDDPYKFDEGSNMYPNTIQVPTSIPKRTQK